jgi:hypothetical protein
MLDTLAAILLILVPIAFNAAFFALGSAFDYPAILREEPGEILRRFHAGGTGLILRWEALLVSALAMIPLTVLFAMCLGAAPALTALTITLGVTAGIVQALGLVRWPFAVPELARRHAAGDAATKASVETVFATLHRLFGVAIGEHLGYLFTGLWTLAVAASVVTTTLVPAWLGWLGVPIAVGLLIGVFEFVGPNEREGWPLAGSVVPIAYIAWSAWLIALGIAVAL